MLKSCPYFACSSWEWNILSGFKRRCQLQVQQNAADRWTIQVLYAENRTFRYAKQSHCQQFVWLCNGCRSGDRFKRQKKPRRPSNGGLGRGAFEKCVRRVLQRNVFDGDWKQMEHRSFCCFCKRHFHQTLGLCCEDQE